MPAHGRHMDAAFLQKVRDRYKASYEQGNRIPRKQERKRIPHPFPDSRLYQHIHFSAPDRAQAHHHPRDPFPRKRSTHAGAFVSLRQVVSHAPLRRASLRLG